MGLLNDRRTAHGLMLAVCLGSIVGCSPEPSFRINAIELRKQEKLSFQEGGGFQPEQVRDVGDLLTALFGTPNKPEFPYLDGEEDPARDLVNVDFLTQAAGPVYSDRQGRAFGLYREHCVQCHGISGDGLGPTAAILDPYPRDFRLGKFKFKSTPIGTPPSHQDLVDVIKNGIPGTAMPSFRALDDQEMNALVHYVRYLAIRGEIERRLMFELAQAPEDRLLPTELVARGDPDGLFADQLDYVIEDVVLAVIEKWLRAERRVVDVPDAPAWVLDSQHPDWADKISRGKELFLSPNSGNCFSCHGETGIGDGQLEKNWDDWTTSWTKELGIDPTDRSKVKEFVALGAMWPRAISPRNLRLGSYRGGRRPRDLYWRIKNGIEGTPMPAAAVTLTDDDIWCLVAYVRNLPYDGLSLSSAKRPSQPPRH